jgi:D-alanine transaminase
VNGLFCPIEQATVSIEDRGFQFGDGVYEVIVSYNGRPFLLKEHMRRLRRSAAAIGLDYDFDASPLEPVLEEGLKRGGLADAMVYIQMTRGVAPRRHPVPERIRPTIVMTFKALNRIPDEVRRRGVSLMTTRDTRWARCVVKAITLLPNVLAKTEALRRGYFDALFVTGSGEVRESTSANVFIVDGGRIRIPPRDDSVLHGITQAFIMTLAKDIDLPVEERTVDLNVLRQADEVFLSGTTVEVLPVTSIDGHLIGDGKVGPITTRLSEAFIARSGADNSPASAPAGHRG